MTSSIAVKVSNKSSLVIRHDRTYRAVSIEELVKISNLYEDCNIIIIESISEKEEEAAKEFILDFCSKNASNKVIFYIPDSSDEVTSGVADELDYDICMRAEEIYSKIREEVGINISPYIADRKYENDISSDVEDIFDIKNETSDEFETAQDNNAEEEVHAVFADITKHDDTPEKVENTVTVDITKKEITDSTAVYVDNKPEKIENTVTVDITKKEITDDTKTSEEEHIENVEQDNAESVEIAEQGEQEQDKASNNAEDNNEAPEVVGGVSQEKYDELFSDMQQATERIGELEEIIQAIEDEKNTILENYNSIVSSDEVYEEDDKAKAEKDTNIKLLEDEVARLSEELQTYKERVEKLNESIADTQSKLDTATDMIKNSGDEHANEVLKITQEIEEVRAEKDKLAKEKSDISDECSQQAKRISELSNKLSAEIAYREATLLIMESTLQKFRSKIEELQKVISDNGSLKKEVEDCNSTISELNDTIAEQSDKLSESASKISEYDKKIADIEQELKDKYSEIEGLSSQIEKLNSTISDKNTEISLSKSSLDKNSTTIAEKDVEISSKQGQIDKLIAQVEELTRSLKEKSQECADFMRKSESLEEKVKELQEAQGGLKKRAELANSYAESEKQRMQILVDKANAKAKLLEDKLKEKEDEITRLKNSPVDIENTILDINDELGVSNDTLKEKIKLISKELGELREQNETLTKKLESSESENRGYKEIIRGINGGEGTRVKSIQFTNMSTQIISVFGSGGTGVTTTAMSIASRLGMSSSVLYMDLDIVTPSSDAWFRRSPFCNSIPGINIQESTALGVLIEHGMSTFSPNMQKLVATVEANKGGGIDYFSGVYYRPDTDKLANADFTTLFNIISPRYNYIVIDLGRLGNSELNDSLIKAITDISFRSIAVTTQDRFEIRNFNLKLNNNSINRLNMCWLANVCASPYLDQKSQEIIGNVPTACLMFDSEIRGRRENFLKTRMNKDTFEMFLKSYVFGRK